LSILAALPLETIIGITRNKHEFEEEEERWVLTADGRAVQESLHHVLVHVDGEFLLLHYALIPFQDSLLDPLREIEFIGGIDDVAQPLLGQLLQLLRDWKVELGNGVRGDVLHDFFDG
jgi:hypothetical protein